MKLTRSSYQHKILLICNLWIVPAKDVFHDAVRHALEKEQWIITDDSLFLRFGGVDMYIDLAAEQLMSAEKNGEKIAIEIKSFIGVSATTEFSTALGQFLKYQLALEEEQPDCILYLGLAEQIQRLFTARVLSLFLAIECKVMTFKGSKPLHPLWEIGG